MYKKILLIIGLLCLFFSISAQDAPTLSTEEILNLKKLAEYNNRWNTFLNIWAFLGPVLAVIVTWLGLRKKVDDWAEAVITKKVNEKLGVDWNVLKKVVEDKQRDLSVIKSRRLAVVNKKTGRRQDLAVLIEKYGFKTPLHFFTLDDFDSGKLDPNNFDLLILDNHDNALSETELRKIIEKHQFPYVLFTIEQTSKAFFDEFRGKVKFAQIQDNIPDYIVQSF